MLSLVAVTLASFVAGFVNAIAGGGGLVSVPALFGVFPHAPASELFGTNKVVMVSGTLQAAASYGRRVSLSWRTLLPAVAAAALGAALGATAVTLVPNDFLRRLLPLMLAAVLAQMLLEPDLGSVHAPRHGPLAEPWLASGMAFLLGLYDGFFGPGTGSFLIFLFVRVLGFDFLHAVASAKILNTATNVGAIGVFAATGNVVWHLVGPMIVANVAGSLLGTHLALRHGSRFIRPVFVTVVAVLILKTGYDAYAG
ncbi:MAG: TSUP family transporter [Planctomycetaceae bacterium]